MAIVLGYHGCDVKAAQELLGGSAFKPSNKPYDWLGAGSYFWEDDIERAYEWAVERRSVPCVVGAVIELGNCLDLTKQSGIRILKFAYEAYVALQAKSGQTIPKNLPGKSDRRADLALRLLDSAVIDHLHSTFAAESKATDGRIREFDTVRAMFPEGNELYPDAGFFEKTHVQIAVRKPEQVLGIFRVPQHQLARLGHPNMYPF